MFVFNDFEFWMMEAGSQTLLYLLSLMAKDEDGKIEIRTQELTEYTVKKGFLSHTQQLFRLPHAGGSPCCQKKACDFFLFLTHTSLEVTTLVRQSPQPTQWEF
jgi:hypothetical protein